MKINNKVPGLGLRLDSTKLDLQYHSRCVDMPRTNGQPKPALAAPRGGGGRSFSSNACPEETGVPPCPPC